MEKKISEMMDCIQDDSVSLTPRSIASTAEIKEAVMKKLHTEKCTYKRKPKLSRTALIAAVVVMILSVAAYAVCRYSLRDLVSGTTVPDGRTTLSMAGYQDSPEYKAAEEWETYIQQKYAAGEMDTQDKSLSPALRDLGACNGEMAAKLQEIAGRYGLTLPQNEQDFANASALYAALSTGAFLPAEPQSGNFEGGGRLYDTGSFRINSATALPGGGKLSYQFYRAAKGGFTRGNFLFAEPDGFEEWAYTTADGTPVLLALGKDKSLLAANLNGSFIFVNILSGTENSDNEKTSFDAQGVTKSDLEAFADGIDFSALNATEK